MGDRRADRRRAQGARDRSGTAALRACVAEAEEDVKVSPVARQRLKDMLDFTTAVDRWYGQMLSIPQGKRDMLMRLGAKIASYLPGGKT